MTLRFALPPTVFAATLLLTADSSAQVLAPWEGFDTSRYPQGHTSWSACSGDFDGDGDADLAVCSWYANSALTLLFGDGAGRFAPPVFYPLPRGAIDLAAADFDTDGDLDLAVANTGQTWEGTSFSLFLNQGNGAFLDAGPRATGKGPAGMATADFDGDGLVDVAVAHDDYIVYGHSIAIVLAGPGGMFQPPSVVQLTPGTFDLAGGDLDGNGSPDLVVVHESGDLSVLINQGGGTFGPASVHTVGFGWFEPYAVALGDVDRDGDLDVLASGQGYGGSGTGKVALFENTGGGALASPVDIPLHPGSDGGTAIEVADVDGDSWPDLLVAAGNSQSWSLLLGDGGGGFQAARELRAGEQPRKVLAVDLDSDQDLDVVVLGGDSLEACVYLNPGDASFVQPPVIEFVPPSYAPCSYSNLESGDIDLDGDRDLVLGFSANFSSIYGLAVRRNLGDGSFAPTETYPHPVFPASVRLRDLDGDGWLDVLFGIAGAQVRVAYRRNLGNGTFGPIVQGPVVGCEAETLDAVDVDADGDLDVVSTCFGALKVCKRNTNGTYASAVSFTISSEATALAAGDFNADGRVDFATNTAVQGYPEILLANSSGGFQPPVSVPAGRDVKAFAVADVNADGDLDLACAFNLDGTGLAVLLGRGDGTFLAPLLYAGSYSRTWDQVRSLALSDVDRDGALDAVIANFGSQDVGYWRGRGDGTFDEVRRLGTGQQGWDIEIADFTGDARVDVAALVQYFQQGWYLPGVVLLRGELGAPHAYCTAGTTTNGCVSTMSASGTPSASAASGFVLAASSLEGQRQGLVFYGVTGANVQPWGGGSSFLCVKPPTQRTPVQFSGGTIGACDGTLALDWNAFRATYPGALGAPFSAGDVVYAQAWFRDPAAPKTTNLSDALQFALFP
jgi:hypothetical protein